MVSNVPRYTPRFVLVRNRVYGSVQNPVGAQVKGGFRWLNDHGHKRPLVRRDGQAGYVARRGFTIPPIDQLAIVSGANTAVGETDSRGNKRRSHQQTGIISLVTVRVDPSSHRHGVRIEVQGRDRNPRGSGVISEAGG